MSAQSEYWEDAVGDAFEQADVFAIWDALPKETRAVVGRALESAADCMDSSFPPPPPNPEVAEIKRLTSALGIERAKRGCPDCGGRGRVSSSAGPWSTNSDCWTCKGEGKVAS